MCFFFFSGKNKYTPRIYCEVSFLGWTIIHRLSASFAVGKRKQYIIRTYYSYLSLRISSLYSTLRDSPVKKNNHNKITSPTKWNGQSPDRESDEKSFRNYYNLYLCFDSLLFTHIYITLRVAFYLFFIPN